MTAGWRDRTAAAGTMIGVRPLVMLVPFVLGCAYDASGQGSGLELGSSSSGAEGGGTTAGATSGSSTSVGLEGSGESGSSSAGSGSSTTAPPETGTSTTGEPLPTARTCKEILDTDPAAPTGTYAVLHEPDGVAIEVHCEMELDGGGWTLVARSAPGPEGPFGWGVARGMVGDESSPYSLDAMALGLDFGEILISRRTGFATPVDHAYVIAVPSGFLEGYRTEAFLSEGARTVLGDCQPADGPTMLRWVGHTDDEENYFFRDFPENHQWGLFPHELRTFYDDCGQGGRLDEEQGALFVR